MKIFEKFILVLLIWKVCVVESELNWKSKENIVSFENQILTKAVNEFLPHNYEQFRLEFLNKSRIILSDAFLTVPQLIKKYGYPSEIHTVHTADGYLLELHRIPREGRIPVLLLHGVLDSSAGWIVMGPQQSLAYNLFDLGYDVWMGNCRGNTYGKKHVFLNPSSKQFWDFSLHELGTMDLPAMFDYVITTTGMQKIHYVAHSQGTTAFFIMCEYRKGYCNKTISMNALSPVAYLNNMKSPLVRGLAMFLNSLELIVKIFGVKEILPNSEIIKMGAQVLCKKKAITQALCVNLLFLVTGYDSEQLNKTMLPVIMGHIPAGSSVKQLVHYGQLVKSGTFRMYDYGFFKNLYIYGHSKPPSYDISKVTAPISIYYSLNDWISNPKDVHRLIKELPNVQNVYLVPFKKFNHMDFLLATDAKELLYNEVIRIMKLSEKVQN